MKKAKVFERFNSLFLFGADILGLSAKEQNVMFLYMFIELLKIADKEGYPIKRQEVSNAVYGGPSGTLYKINFTDYDYMVTLCLYNDLSRYNRYSIQDMEITICKSCDYQKPFHPQKTIHPSFVSSSDDPYYDVDAGYNKIIDSIIDYVNKHSRIGAYLILNEININNLRKEIEE